MSRSADKPRSSQETSSIPPAAAFARPTGGEDACVAPARYFGDWSNPVPSNFPAMMHAVDEQGRIIAVTDLWLALLGYARDEVVGRRSVDFLTPESRRRAEGVILPEFFRTGHTTGAHYQFLKKNGEVVEAVLSAIALRDERDEFICSVSVLVDVSDAQRAQARAQAAELRYAQLFNAVTDYVFTVRVENGCAVSTSHGVGCEGVTGFAPEDYEADPFLWYRMVHEEDRETVLDLARSVLAGRQPSPLEHRIWHKNGELCWVRNVTVPHYDAGGSLIAYDGVITNITELKLAEEALRASEARFRALIENASDMIMILSERWRIEYQSPSLERTLGYEPQQFQGRSVFEFAHPEDADRVRIALERLCPSDGGSARFEMRALHCSGTWVHLDVVACNLVDAPHVRGLVVVARDVTERKREENARQLLESQLHHAQKMDAVGQLAGGVAHSFNNLLTGILGNLSLARGDCAPEQLSDYLALAEKACLRASDLVRQMLAFSRKSQTAMVVIRLEPILKEVANIMRSTIDYRIEVRVDFASDLHPVKADASQIQQVILNLCINARDAIETKWRESEGHAASIVLSAENVEAASTSGVGGTSFVRLSVADTGVGMGDDVKARLFEPFFTTKELGKGTGLGLATVYGLVKQHGGWVECSSRLGIGSTFDVFLPATPSSAGAIEVSGEATDAPRGTETILVIDDEELVRGFACAVLRKLGYHVIAAADGQEGVDVFTQRANEIALVLLDLSMPRMSGREALQRIRQISPSAKVVVSSGYSAEGVSDLVGDLGASGYIAKPYEVSQLAQVLRETLAAS